MPTLNPGQSNIIQEILSNRITKFVFWGTAFIGVIGLIFGFFALYGDEQKVKTAFSILQYVFGALLPLWGTWIGTILAYYYSQKNFESANQSIQKMVDKVTSDQKLASVKALDVSIKTGQLKALTMDATDTLAKFKLDDCLNFLSQNNIKRVIILRNNCAVYAIHRDTISFFISSLTLAGKSVTGLSLDDMYKHGPSEIQAVLNDGVAFIPEDASLLTAKSIMVQNRNCQDVFVTKNGNADEPVLGWVTNVTIAQNSIV